MNTASGMVIFVIILMVVSLCAAVYLFVLLVKALKKYIQSEPVRKEFVAEALGVSRQAVSKWESGASDPSTTNLMALAKLYGVAAEDLLRESR